jgi:hypothetical protein
MIPVSATIFPHSCPFLPWSVRPRAQHGLDDGGGIEPFEGEGGEDGIPGRPGVEVRGAAWF